MTEHPPLPDTHWLWRRFLAFMSFAQLCHRTTFGGPPEYEVWAYVFLCAQWAVPALLEDLMRLWLSVKERK